MTTGLVCHIESGAAVELPDVIANLMQGFFWDFRDGTKLTPLAKIKEEVAKDIASKQRDLDEAENALIEFNAASPADRHAKYMARVAESAIEADRTRAEKEEVIARFTAAEAKLVAWSPPESILELKEGMLRHLREQIEHERGMLKYTTGIKPMSVDEVFTTFKFYREEDVKTARKKLAKAQKEGEEKIKFRTELYAELNRIGLKV